MTGCGPARHYAYAVRYDPLVLGDAAKYFSSLEEITPEPHHGGSQSSEIATIGSSGTSSE